jgi:hypothetical protein
MTADREPDSVTPDPVTPDPVVPEQAAEAAAPAMVEPGTPDPAPLLPDVVPVLVIADPAAPPKASRRRRIAVGTWRVLRPILSLGLLVLGIVIGANVYSAVQPKDPAVIANAPSSVQPPAAVREFITALAANNPDALRASVPADPYRLLAGELETRGYQEVTSVDTLGTIMDGERSATEIVIHGSASGGQGLVVNLVVHADNGVIVNFR